MQGAMEFGERRRLNLALDGVLRMDLRCFAAYMYLLAFQRLPHICLKFGGLLGFFFLFFFLFV
jgi:hypothetical protein